MSSTDEGMAMTDQNKNHGNRFPKIVMRQDVSDAKIHFNLCALTCVCAMKKKRQTTMHKSQTEPAHMPRTSQQFEEHWLLEDPTNGEIAYLVQASFHPKC